MPTLTPVDHDPFSGGGNLAWRPPSQPFDVTPGQQVAAAVPQAVGNTLAGLAQPLVGGYQAVDDALSGAPVSQGQQMDRMAALGGLMSVPGGEGDPAAAEMGIRAYHGSPYSFNAFDASKIGTGEGAQAYGRGLYFAGNEGVAKSYRDTLGGKSVTDASGSGLGSNDILGQITSAIHTAVPSYAKPVNAFETQQIAGSVLDRIRSGDTRSLDSMARDYDGGTDPESMAWSAALNAAKSLNVKNNGSMYQVDIDADPDHFLDWDKPLAQQHPVVQQALGAQGYGPAHTGADVVGNLSGQTDPAAAAQQLQAQGIPGIKYLDAGSRAAGQGSQNYVVFDPATISIIRKYGLAGVGLGGAALGGMAGGAGTGVALTPVDHDPFVQSVPAGVPQT